MPEPRTRTEPAPPPDVAGRSASDLPRSIVAWLRAGTLDAPLAAVVWLLAEGGIPILVAGPAGAPAAELRAALAIFGRAPSFLDPFPASLEGTSLEEVQARLAEAPYDLTEDAIRSVGVVLVLRASVARRWRVGAAHYVRPLEQDVHGHVQRRPPALLAGWDEPSDRFDDYAWGITSELAGRIGRSPEAFERAREARSHLLDHLVEDGVVAPAAVAAALAAQGSTGR